MKGYRVEKTTMGRKIRIRMSEDEIAERELYHLAIVALPLFFSALMFFLWVKVG